MINDRTVLVLADQAARQRQAVRVKIWPTPVSERQVWLEVNGAPHSYHGSRAYRAACAQLLGVMEASRGGMSDYAAEVRQHLGDTQYILDRMQVGRILAERYEAHLAHLHTMALIEHMSTFPNGSREQVARNRAVEGVTDAERRGGYRLPYRQYFDRVADRIQELLPEYAAPTP